MRCLIFLNLLCVRASESAEQIAATEQSIITNNPISFSDTSQPFNHARISLSLQSLLYELQKNIPGYSGDLATLAELQGHMKAARLDWTELFPHSQADNAQFCKLASAMIGYQRRGKYSPLYVTVLLLQLEWRLVVLMAASSNHCCSIFCSEMLQVLDKRKALLADAQDLWGYGVIPDVFRTSPIISEHFGPALWDFLGAAYADARAQSDPCLDLPEFVALLNHLAATSDGHQEFAPLALQLTALVYAARDLAPAKDEATKLGAFDLLLSTQLQTAMPTSRAMLFSFVVRQNYLEDGGQPTVPRDLPGYDVFVGAFNSTQFYKPLLRALLSPNIALMPQPLSRCDLGQSKNPIDIFREVHAAKEPDADVQAKLRRVLLSLPTAYCRMTFADAVFHAAFGHNEWDPFDYLFGNPGIFDAMLQLQKFLAFNAALPNALSESFSQTVREICGPYFADVLQTLHANRTEALDVGHFFELQDYTCTCKGAEFEWSKNTKAGSVDTVAHYADAIEAAAASKSRASQAAPVLQTLCAGWGYLQLINSQVLSAMAALSSSVKTEQQLANYWQDSKTRKIILALFFKLESKEFAHYDKQPTHQALLQHMRTWLQHVQLTWRARYAPFYRLHCVCTGPPTYCYSPVPIFDLDQLRNKDQQSLNICLFNILSEMCKSDITGKRPTGLLDSLNSRCKDFKQSSQTIVMASEPSASVHLPGNALDIFSYLANLYRAYLHAMGLCKQTTRPLRGPNDVKDIPAYLTETATSLALMLVLIPYQDCRILHLLLSDDALAAFDASGHAPFGPVAYADMQLITIANWLKVAKALIFVDNYGVGGRCLQDPYGLGPRNYARQFMRWRRRIPVASASEDFVYVRNFHVTTGANLYLPDVSLQQILASATEDKATHFLHLALTCLSTSSSKCGTALHLWRVLLFHEDGAEGLFNLPDNNADSEPCLPDASLIRRSLKLQLSVFLHLQPMSCTYAQDHALENFASFLGAVDTAYMAKHRILPSTIVDGRSCERERFLRALLESALTASRSALEAAMKVNLAKSKPTEASSLNNKDNRIQSKPPSVAKPSSTKPPAAKTTEASQDSTAKGAKQPTNKLNGSKKTSDSGEAQTNKDRKPEETQKGNNAGKTAQRQGKKTQEQRAKELEAAYLANQQCINEQRAAEDRRKQELLKMTVTLQSRNDMEIVSLFVFGEDGVAQLASKISAQNNVDRCLRFLADGAGLDFPIRGSVLKLLDPSLAGKGEIVNSGGKAWAPLPGGYDWSCCWNPKERSIEPSGNQFYELFDAQNAGHFLPLKYQRKLASLIIYSQFASSKGSRSVWVAERLGEMYQSRKLILKFVKSKNIAKCSCVFSGGVISYGEGVNSTLMRRFIIEFVDACDPELALATLQRARDRRRREHDEQVRVVDETIGQANRNIVALRQAKQDIQHQIAKLGDEVGALSHEEEQIAAMQQELRQLHNGLENSMAENARVLALLEEGLRADRRRQEVAVAKLVSDIDKLDSWLASSFGNEAPAVTKLAEIRSKLKGLECIDVDAAQFQGEIELLTPRSLLKQFHFTRTHSSELYPNMQMPSGQHLALLVIPQHAPVIFQRGGVTPSTEKPGVVTTTIADYLLSHISTVDASTYSAILDLGNDLPGLPTDKVIHPSPENVDFGTFVASDGEFSGIFMFTILDYTAKNAKALAASHPSGEMENLRCFLATLTVPLSNMYSPLDIVAVNRIVESGFSIRTEDGRQATYRLVSAPHDRIVPFSSLSFLIESSHFDIADYQRRALDERTSLLPVLQRLSQSRTLLVLHNGLYDLLFYVRLLDAAGFEEMRTRLVQLDEPKFAEACIALARKYAIAVEKNADIAALAARLDNVDPDSLAAIRRSCLLITDENVQQEIEAFAQRYFVFVDTAVIFQKFASKIVAKANQLRKTRNLPLLHMNMFKNGGCRLENLVHTLCGFPSPQGLNFHTASVDAFSTAELLLFMQQALTPEELRPLLNVLAKVPKRYDFSSAGMLVVNEYGNVGLSFDSQ